jgi:hypothetical protein
MVGALFGAGLGLTPSAVAAVVALLAGGCSVAAAATRLARLGTGVRAERARRVDQAICIAAVLVAVAAVGLGGSTLWSAVTSTSAVG